MRAIIVIPASDRDAANAAVKQHLDPAAGELTFTTPLSPNGEKPHTHYWCSAEFSEKDWETFQVLKEQFPQARVEEYNLDEHPDFPAQLLVEMNLRTIDQKFPISR